VSYVDLLALLPELILIAVALFVLLLDLFLRPDQKHQLVRWSLLGVGAALVANALVSTRSEPLAQGMIRFDEISQYLNLVFLLGAGMALALADEYVRRQEINRGEYYTLLLISTAGAMFMGSSADLLMLFLGLETLSIPLYILSTFFRKRPASQEAGLKYFLLGAFSSALFLYGIALVYGATGSTQLVDIVSALSGALAATPLLLYAGVGLLLVGLGFKAAAVPFHTWAPDVYEGAPTSVTAFMAVAAKVGAFAAFLRVLVFAPPALAEGWTVLVGTLAVLTMILGNVVAVVQLGLKRLLAYSSIGHAGYLLVAVASAQGPALLGSAATSSLLFYLLIYTLMTLGAFGVIVLAEGRGENLSLNDLSGLAARHPWIAGAMALFMISLAGLPPTAGFFAKFYVFSAAVQAGQLGLVIVGVLASVVSVYYYLRVVYYIYMLPMEVERPLHISPLALASLALAAVGILALGVYPTWALDWLSQTLMALP
jgi:NADH-quinone oxidoreductase subunit N